MAVPRRQSLAMLYAALRSDDSEDPFDPIKEAGGIFEEEDEASTSTRSLFSTPSPRFSTRDIDADADDETGSESESDVDDDDEDNNSDVEPMDLSNASDCVIVDDPVFIPHREQSPEITALASLRKASPRVLLAPPSPESRPIHRYAAPTRPRTKTKRETITTDDDDDEYMPSPQLVPRKRKHPTRSPSLSPAPYRAFSEQGPSDSDRPAKRRRPAPVSRNRQTTQAEVQRAEASDEFADFKCKVCGWIQHNKRVPDFKRHVKTHQREADDKANRGWACAGVKASEYTGKADVYEYLGERRAGGCRKTFSRRDALKRHLENPNVKCVSEILSRESE